MVPDGPGISKYDLLSLFNRYIRKNSIDIIPDDAFHNDKTLVRIRDDSPYIPQDSEGQVRDLGCWIRAHGELNPHYDA